MYLKSKNINYHLFDYVKKYNEKDYIAILQKAKYGIILDAHESQGFAIEEALSCNVPLLVWNVRYMSQEHGSKYDNISCSSIEYWDERCGESFYNIDELNSSFNNFLSKLDSYQPRQYIIDNLSIDPCFEILSKLFQELK
jgi:glycosyltransferase involved in cell wall biosynthesis